MPISSRFGYTPSQKPIVRPQIVSRAPKFRENHRNKNQNDSKATAGGKLPAQRPTAVVKLPFRSDTFTLPTKRDEIHFKVPNVNQAQNGSRRQPTNKPDVINSSLPVERKDIMRKNVGNHPMIKQVNSPMDRQNLQRKPVRFANDYHNTYYSSSHASPPVYYQRSAPLADPLDNSRRTRITSDNYITHRRKGSPAYAYNDYYHTVSNIPTVSYKTSLPPINQTAPTVVIRPQEIAPPQPPPPAPAPIFILPSAAPPMSTMTLPTSTFPTYADEATTTIYTTVPPQLPPPTYFMPPAPPPPLPQPFFFPFPYPNPPAPPQPQPQTVVNQTTSSSASASTAVKSENKIEENNPTIIVRPYTTDNKKNITIQLGMRDNPQRVVRVVHDPPYREVDDLVYIDSEPKHVIYEAPQRRTAFIRRPPPPQTEYVYVDESPSSVVRRHPHRSEVVYIDNNHPLEYEEEIVYVDDYGNKLDYIYDDEPVYHRRNNRKSYHPSSTNIVYK